MAFERLLRGRGAATAKSLTKVVRAEIARVSGSRRFAFPALNNLDRSLLELLPESGTYLEIGGNDGYSQSNTYYLEKYKGWRGILIEPLPSLYKISRLHRRRATIFNVACAGIDGSTEIVDRGLMSVSVNLLQTEDQRSTLSASASSIAVRTRRISDLIDEAGFDHITLMSVDVEGAEISVLEGLDLRRHRPDFLLIETANPAGVSSRLDGHMRLERKLSHHDYLFISDDVRTTETPQHESSR